MKPKNQRGRTTEDAWIAAGDRERAASVAGDILQPQTWAASAAGHDAVLSCLGSRDRKHPTTVYSQGTKNVIDAMRQTGMRRLICLSSAGLEIPSGTPALQRLVTRVVIQRLYRHGYADMAVMEDLVTASGIDWTIIRPPMLTDGPLTQDYRAAADGHLWTPKSVSRANLAHYMLTHVDDRDSWQRTVEIST